MNFLLRSILLSSRPSYDCSGTIINENNIVLIIDTSAATNLTTNDLAIQSKLIRS